MKSERMEERLGMVDEIERTLSQSLEIPVIVRLSKSPVQRDRLSRAERERLVDLQYLPRREAWLRGRRALKDLLCALGEEADTTTLRFPHPRISLSHSGAWAIAVGTAEPATYGIGIDLEFGPGPSVRALRFFLTDRERRGVEALSEPEQSRERLRLWTVKEALYKADLENGSTWYTEYLLASPLVGSEGEVREHPCITEGAATRCTQVHSRTFRYASQPFLDGWISIAIAGQAGVRPAPPEAARTA